jgi:trans-aconitate methyltransferase
MDLSEVPGELFVRHPWERARLDFFHRLLVDHADLDRARRILDVGSGDGWLARELLSRLPAHASIACFDAAYAEVGFPPSDPRITFHATRPEGAFDVLLFLDVLEHVEDDRAFLPEIVRANATRESRVLLTVPAWSALTSSHDTMLQHHRRYSPRELIALARHAGLRPVRQGELFTSLLLPRALTVLKERTLGVNGTPGLHWKHGERAARVVQTALSVDARFCRAVSDAGLRVPGLSTWVLCELA